MIEVRTVAHEVACCEDCDGVPAAFRYDRADPFAVTVVFEEEGEQPNVWLFARDLLDDGMDARVGLGDVQIWPDGNRVVLSLADCGRGGATVAVRFARRTVAKFLALTRKAVPYQREHVDVDAIVRQIDEWWVTR